ncbi:MAG: hypothetical protein AB8H47_06710, partial [Bacteroidia bacterium]
MKSILTYTSLFSWISLSLWVFLPTNSLAQSKDECMSKITKAEEYYSAGLFDQVLKLGLIPCLEADLKRDDKSRALKLLVLIKLYREEQDSALYFMQQLLDNDPEYSPSVIDPIEFENLHRRFDTAPIRLIEFRAGINLNIPIRDPNGAYTVGPNPASQNLNYFSKVGFHAGILWEKPILERPSKPFGLNFSTGAAYQFRQFQHSESLPYIESFDPNGDNSFELTFFEQQHWIDLPVSLHLNVRRNLTARIDNLEIYPYFSFGIVGHYLLSA